MSALPVPDDRGRCAFRGIGKPPHPPQCTEWVRLDEAPYCDEHRCTWDIQNGSPIRCAEKRYYDSEYCEAHGQIALALNDTPYILKEDGRNLGLGPDAPTVTAANGAKQSHAPYAFTSIDPLALFRIAETQKGGDEKYGPDNWRRLPVEDHINHALAHIFGHQAGDQSDDHLAHAATRLLEALAVHLRPDFYGKDA